MSDKMPAFYKDHKMATKNTSKGMSPKTTRAPSRRTKPAPTPAAAPAGSKYNQFTREGRAVIDAAVLKKVGKRLVARGDIAKALEMQAHLVSASLRRLEAAGEVSSNDETRGLKRYCRRG